MLKNAIYSLALTASLCCFNVQAGIITLYDTFGTQGSTNDVKLGTLNKTLTIPGFDTALGNLDNVKITVYSQMNSAGTSTNKSQSHGRADVEMYWSANWQVSTSAADTHIFANASFTPYLRDKSSDTGIFTLATDDTFSYAFGTNTLTAQLNNVSTTDFTSGNNVGFTFSGKAKTNINNQVESGTGLFSNSFDTAVWGKVEVQYTYSNTTIPEPTPLALFAMGLLVLVTATRRKA